MLSLIKAVCVVVSVIIYITENVVGMSRAVCRCSCTCTCCNDLLMTLFVFYECIRLWRLIRRTNGQAFYSYRCATTVIFPECLKPCLLNFRMLCKIRVEWKYLLVTGGVFVLMLMPEENWNCVVTDSAERWRLSLTQWLNEQALWPEWEGKTPFY